MDTVAYTPPSAEKIEALKQFMEPRTFSTFTTGALVVLTGEGWGKEPGVGPETLAKGSIVTIRDVKTTGGIFDEPGEQKHFFVSHDPESYWGGKLYVGRPERVEKINAPEVLVENPVVLTVNPGDALYPSPEKIAEFQERIKTPDVRTFSTGANRDTDTGKPDYEGFLCPEVLVAYGRYMHRNRTLNNGEVRASDNWQKGIPKDAYVKSLWRHFMDLWRLHRGKTVTDPKSGREVTKEEACCAIMFNVMGYLHETLK
jgi:hypothetical protein